MTDPTPTTLAGWVTHCREQADTAEASARQADGIAGQLDRNADKQAGAGWQLLAAALRQSAQAHRDDAQQKQAEAADWRALADVVDAASSADWYLQCHGEETTIAAVARIAAHLPTTTDERTTR